MIRFSSQPAWWPAARQQQLVQGSAPDVDANEPSALVIAMAMLGVLVCMIPLGVFAFLGLGERALLGTTGLVLSLLVLAAGGALLRKTEQAFLSCTALVLWALGCALLLINLGSDQFESRDGALVLCALAAALQVLGAWLARPRWIQAIMGVFWAVAVYGLCMLLQSYVPWLLVLRLDCLVLALLWWCWLKAEPARLARPQHWYSQTRWAVFADAAMVGVLLSIGAGFYESAWLDIAGHRVWSQGWEDGFNWVFVATRWLSAATALAGVALLLRSWRSRGLPQPVLAMALLAGVLLAVCAWFSPSLGDVVLIAAAALFGARWRIALLCAVLGLVTLGKFYYALHWPLAIKGLGLAALGAVLLVGLLLLRKRSATAVAAVQETKPSKAPLGWVLLGALLVFGLVNWDVRGKEQVIAHGQRILVPLVPVDPRSLMQGDYMDLRFELPAQVENGLAEVLGPSATVRAMVDAQGRARVTALADERQPAKAGEISLPLKRLKGRWVLVTDAYFFPEGQGEHFAAGRYGNFRVLPDGRALLVGLADAQGQAIQPLPGGSIWESRPAQQRLREDAPPVDAVPEPTLDPVDPESAPQAERPASAATQEQPLKAEEAARRATEEAQKAAAALEKQ
nr:GDYXXLXY domain-containing protein [Comamonas testosteroni]